MADEQKSNPLATIGRFFRRNLPRGLFARSLLIIVLPMLILQTVLVFVFMERHWQMVTSRLSAAVTRDIASIIDLLDKMPGRQDEIIRIAEDRMGLTVKVMPGDKLPPRKPVPFFSILDKTLSRQINKQINRPFWIDSSLGPKQVEVRLVIDGKRILSVVTQRDRTSASNSQIFLIWMFGTSLVLIIISILFLRGQIRPILALARAAESFGKGQKPAEPYHPRGAVEVRRAGMAFLQMRERIERQIEQRTAMLSGVSHDLRTILTRFRLQLAIAEDMKDLDSLNRDVDDMNAMLDGYLAFARGQSEEAEGELELTALLRQLEETAALHGKTLTTAMDGPPRVKVRPNAFSRLITNLATNAWRHADTVRIEARHSGRFLVVTVDDNGPGIVEAMRDEVFKPFFRLDEARNLDASGTGLGLAIARDIARGHGGDVTLSDSPMGGLRATVRVPV
ncbi:MAG: two-component sensor histidine kinase [Rhizobiaceae bacterium]|nr:two-component sensor histidine kinase [Rhizobiaceae bacterium]